MTLVHVTNEYAVWDQRFTHFYDGLYVYELHWIMFFHNISSYYIAIKAETRSNIK